MSLTNTQAITLYHTIGKFEKREDLPTKFSWALMRTKKRLQNVIDSVNELRKPHPRMNEFETLRIELCNTYCEKDDKGAPKIEDNNFVIGEESRKELDDKIVALKEGEFKPMFDEQQKKSEEFAELLKEECDVELFKISEQYLPETMSPADLEILEPMIEV